MGDRPNEGRGSKLPRCAADFVDRVAKKIRYRRKVRQDVQAEMTAHFEDELRDCADTRERERQAKKLIEEFGDAKLLAVLCRRAKKRCRPLWAKVAIRALQVGGVLVLYSVLCSLRLFIGSPSFKVDYLAWLSERTRAGHAEALNAKPYFDKAADLVRERELIQKAFDIVAKLPGDTNEPERQLLVNVVERNAEAFEVLRQGVARPHYWVQYETAAREALPADVIQSWSTGLKAFPDMMLAFNHAMMAHGPGYRMLAQAFYVSICWKAHQGDVGGAVDDCLILMDFGMHLEGRGAEIEQLIGIALDAMGNHAVFELLARYGVAGLDLGRVADRLVDLYARHESIIDVAGNRAVWLAMIQQAFTDDGAGNGRVLNEGVSLAARDWQDGVSSLLLFGYPDRKEITSLFDAVLAEYQFALETEPSDPQHESRKPRWMALAQKSFFLKTQAPAMERLVSLVWRVQTGRRALLTSLAVMRYAHEKGVHPTMLDTLVAEGYVKELPIDPYSGKTFGYQRTAEGFLLYSWGMNLVDDSGRQGIGQNGQARMFAENGDWVFWPVSETPKTRKTPVQSGMDEEKAVEYRAAAPLNHTVRIERIGRYLKLDYELIGMDGKKYDLWEIGDQPKPTFAIYQGNARVGGDTFEFG